MGAGILVLADYCVIWCGRGDGQSMPHMDIISITNRSFPPLHPGDIGQWTHLCAGALHNKRNLADGGESDRCHSPGEDSWHDTMIWEGSEFVWKRF